MQCAAGPRGAVELEDFDWVWTAAVLQRKYSCSDMLAGMSDMLYTGMGCPTKLDLSAVG